MAVEQLASALQHHQQHQVLQAPPHFQSDAEHGASVPGFVLHQLHGFLAEFRNLLFTACDVANERKESNIILLSILSSFHSPEHPLHL